VGPSLGLMLKNFGCHVTEILYRKAILQKKKKTLGRGMKKIFFLML
jgi:hypothetical protein